MNTYALRMHGDSLEKHAADFIQNKFPNYEIVWKDYIGNKGDCSLADIPNYPYNLSRKNFSEHSYTILESLFIINLILEKGELELEIKSITDYYNFNKSYISFFAHLGRIKDNLIKMCSLIKLEKNTIEKIEAEINHIYKARNIILHGKNLPFEQIDGHIKIPHLFDRSDKTFAWDDTNKNWDDRKTIGTQNISNTTKAYFNDILQLTNNVYGKFHNKITATLKELNTNIEFSFNGKPINVYNIQLDPSNSLHK